MSQPRVGIWLIGARGGVATTALVGWSALRRRPAPALGLVTALPQFARLPLAEWDEFVVGGHEIRKGSLLESAMRLMRDNRVLDEALVGQCAADLEAVDRRIRPGVLWGVGPAIEALADADIPRDGSPRAAMRRIQTDLEEFAHREHVEHVIVVNVASTEPPADPAAVPAHVGASWSRCWTSRERCPLPASSLYADRGAGPGLFLRQFHALARLGPGGDRRAGPRSAARATWAATARPARRCSRACWPPCSGDRNLQVMSWVGHNIFGNLDGQVLDDPANKQTEDRQQGPPAWPRSSATGRRRTSRSSTSRAWATGRRPGTTSTSRASWARR